MNAAELRAAYERDGFVVVRGFLAGQALAELQAQLARYIQEVVPTLPASEAFFETPGRLETVKQLNRIQQDPYFAEYARHPQWQALAEAVLGETAICQGPEWFNKPPGSQHPTPPHQDNYYFNLAPPSVCTIWLALDDVDDENGCLRYVRGSHLSGFRPHERSRVLGFSQGISDYGPADEAAEVKVHAQPGDALVHHGNTIHRAEMNRSATRHRRAFAMVYRGASARRDERRYANYLASLEEQHAELGLAKR